MSDPTSRSETGEGNGADFTGQFTAFNRIWADTFARLMQISTTFSPASPPPEILRDMRANLLQALSRSWDEYLRSPQFMETTRQWIEQTVNLRQMTNNVLTRMHHEMQTPPREDIDAVLLSVRHLERRLLDRLEEIEARFNGNGSRSTRPPSTNERPAPGRRRPAKKPKAARNRAKK